MYVSAEFLDWSINFLGNVNSGKNSDTIHHVKYFMVYIALKIKLIFVLYVHCQCAYTMDFNIKIFTLLLVLGM